jgi:hypothetical protein
MAMPPDTAAVTVGSAHCGGKWDGCAKISPMNVAIALIVACRAALSIVRSICARRATATAPLTIPQTEARNACSKLNAAKTFPRAITRKQASHAPANFSATGRASPPARKSPNASRRLNFKLRIDRASPLRRLSHRLFSCAVRRRERVMNSCHMGSILVDRSNTASRFSASIWSCWPTMRAHRQKFGG